MGVVDHLPYLSLRRDRDRSIVGGGDVAERKARLLLEQAQLNGQCANLYSTVHRMGVGC